MWLSYYKVWQFNFAGFFYIFRITMCGKVILLQSVSCITKCETDCCCKVRQVLQKVTNFIKKCVRYYKVRHDMSQTLGPMKELLISNKSNTSCRLNLRIIPFFEKRALQLSNHIQGPFAKENIWYSYSL